QKISCGAELQQQTRLKVLTMKRVRDSAPLISWNIFRKTRGKRIMRWKSILKSSKRFWRATMTVASQNVKALISTTGTKRTSDCLLKWASSHSDYQSTGHAIS